MSGSLVSPIQTYLADSANEAKFASATARGNAQQTNLINYFTANAGKITSPAALLGNYKALSVVLGAFGIGGLINSTALVKQLLTQDPGSTSSVAYRIGNAKYLAFAKAMQSWTPPPFSSASGINAIVDAYKKYNYEAAAGAQTPGMQQALYFTRTAGSIKSLTQLQSDADLMAVAVTGLGLPLTAFDNLSFEQQTSLMKNKLNLGDLQKPAYVQHLAELYLVQQQLANGMSTPTVQPGSMVALFSHTTASSSANALFTILQNAQPNSAGTTSLLGTSSASTKSLLSLFA